MTITKIPTDMIKDNAVTADKLANTLDLSGKTVTLAPGEISAGELASTLDLSSKTVTLDAAAKAPDYLEYRDEKAANTAGGTFTSGAWRTRTLNVEAFDTGSRGSLGSNQITLAAGTYECEIIVPGFACEKHVGRLQNITDTATTLIGSAAQASASGTGSAQSSIITGRFTIAGSKVFEVQHQCSATRATDGFGVAANLGVTEVYTIARFWKVA